jgi:glycogen synthase kinase 3 beta
LVYDPLNRPKPLNNLADPYFDELRDPNTRLPNGMPLPDLFNFTPGMNYFDINLKFYRGKKS